MKRKVLFLVAVLGAGAYAAFSFSSDEPKQAGQGKPGDTLRVTVTNPTEQRVIERVGVTGTLVPREEVTVVAEVANARILIVSAEVGDHVRKGDTLAVLDAEGARLQIAQMEAEYAKARDEFSRVDTIKDTGAVSTGLVIEKKKAVDAIKARLEEARLAVRRTAVTAPEGGIVFERRATIGGLANTSEVLFRIARHGEIEAELRVPEGSASRVPPAAAVSLSISGQAVPSLGTVRLVSPRIDASDRSAPVRVAIPANDGLKVGAYVHADIALTTVTALAVPGTAIQRDGGGAFVWAVEAEGRIVRHAVTPLLQQDDVTLVTGVTSDLRVVARAGSLVRSGDAVKIVEAR
ncbi:efflux RND transporter periplasmic adaptor subunit [Nitrospirillum pindoramense]|uniref:RND family efflux transporter MFP subunit n=1 Tax=Nitrospirillum amazonense TaxID=28077 RepID=A0A560HCX9_9PROT|nr:efflux RND transporter periplasmic adaptor subunit [Nitrospirillum amazonense]TWB43951.1 RND family efflux transporter MFP subunit [Nitrospirillum amazonense]